LVDPSLFTAPYDAELDDGLSKIGVQTTWAARNSRRNEDGSFPFHKIRTSFYSLSDRLPRSYSRWRSSAKAIEHIFGLLKLVYLGWTSGPDVVHIQWTPFPILDAAAIWLIGARATVVVTLHDTTPYNGERMPLLQRCGYFLPAKLANRVIVHTAPARDRLLVKGFDREKVCVVAHGALPLRGVQPSRTERVSQSVMTFVLFGQLKPYKGVDVLISAVAQLPEKIRNQCRFIIAGAPMMDMEPIRKRIATLNVGSVVELRLHRLSEQEMADLFNETDAFLFPYLAIDASGVYFLVKHYAKWIIASRVGIFAEELREGINGTLVGPAKVDELAEAIAWVVDQKPRVVEQPNLNSEWEMIAQATVRVYLGGSSEAARDRSADA